MVFISVMVQVSSNASAVIGNNVNLSQFTTIGSVKGHVAIIGNDVYIGPSVCLVEDVVIGDGAAIRAGAVVNKNIPAGAVAARVPAKVINDSAGYTPANRYIVKP